MTREECISKRDEAIASFGFNACEVNCERYGSGHINDTFLIKTADNEKYILQRLNHEIFKEPDKLMENIYAVTEFLKKKIAEACGNPKRETLNLVSTADGAFYYKDSIGCFWRMYEFIDNATSFNAVKDVRDFYESAVSFGHFQKMLSDFDARSLYEVIKDFHNTPKRYEKFLEAVEKDSFNRKESCAEEIKFFMDRYSDMCVCMNELNKGTLPLRVTHNDTKLNNIMIDDATHKGICVIDLDTVMPGLSIFDFGDSIRFGANTAAEDEKDLSKVSLSLEFFEAYVRGFLEGCEGSLTKREIELMPMGAKTMTLECGMRFLTDYLNGDVYFMVHRDGHNLDRARTQIELVKDMERKWDKMGEIVLSCGE